MKRSKLMGEPLDVSVGLTSVTLGVTKSWREGEGVSRDFLKSGYFACTICCKSFGVFGVATHEVDISIIIQAEFFGGSSFVALRFSVFLAAKRKACRAFFSWGFYHPCGIWVGGFRFWFSCRCFWVFLLRSPVHVVILIFNFYGFEQPTCSSFFSSWWVRYSFNLEVCVKPFVNLDAPIAFSKDHLVFLLLGGSTLKVYQWHSTVPFCGNFRIDVKLARSVEHFGSKCWGEVPVSREDVSTFFSIPWGNPYFRIAGAKFCSNAKPESEIEEVFFSDCLYPFFIFRFIVKLEGYDIDYRGRKSGRRPRKGIVHDAGHVLMSFLIQDNIIECRRRVRRCLVSKVFEKDGEFSLSSFDESRVLLAAPRGFWLSLHDGGSRYLEVLMRSGAFVGAAVAYVIFIVGGVFDDDVASPGSKVRVVTTEVSIEERTIPSAGVSISTLRYFELKMIGWVGIVRENFSSYFDPEFQYTLESTGGLLRHKQKFHRSFISRTSCIISLRVGWPAFINAFIVMFPNMELEFSMVHFGPKLRAMFRDMLSNRFDSSSGVTRFEDHAVEVTGVSSIQKDMGGVPSILDEFLSHSS
ncbi:unnamed protein product [Polarella glacialis]|uniref:Uncharacterized protein n=1 Tax=Polarella glacialis TaxID=89957 RepID=A0A813E1S3_POLGL|nr:unnamed protein product [Polarella glacialis]